MEPWRTILKRIERDGAVALVTVAKVEGSTPREAGARMVVAADGATSGSIGGGMLEWDAIACARQLLRNSRPVQWRTVSLGPALDQCCGGRAELLHEVFDARDRDWIAPLAAHTGASLSVRAEPAADGRYRRAATKARGALDQTIVIEKTGALVERFGEARTPLLLFGAGHVGRALVRALAPLPFSIRWIDDRADASFAGAAEEVETLVTALPEAELQDAPAGTFVLVMTHSHALDMMLVAAALPQARFPYVGLIGSATKRATFERRLREQGIAPEAIRRLVCPIGVAGIVGKSPPVIAASVAAELLLVRGRLAATPAQAEATLG
jgi:xanthine dehydrogenase accessory factor